jgi:hypothetical protein
MQTVVFASKVYGKFKKYVKAIVIANELVYDVSLTLWERIFDSYVFIAFLLR